MYHKKHFRQLYLEIKLSATCVALNLSFGYRLLTCKASYWYPRDVACC